MAVRGDIRNVAIVAHVDHGKTTLVNAMLAQSHVFNEREEVPDRVMDSNDLEREKGITILAKNTAVQYTGPLAAKYGHPEGITLNIIDTPGHADFGGEVERGISMVDGVVLLVDASEGPLPQTRFVLRKALEAKLPVILCVNKTDRPDARISEVVGESSDLLLGLAQDVIEEGIDLDEDSLFDLPVIYCAAKAGYASENQPENGGLPDNDNLEPLFEAIIKNIPAPEYEEGAPLQAHVANIDSSDFLGRLGLVRIYNGTLEKGKTYGLSRVDGSIENFRVSELLRTQQLGHAEVLDGAVHTGQTVGLALLKGAVVDADQTESAEEVGGIDVGDVGLQRRAFLVFRSRNVLDDGLEQRLEVVVVRQAAVFRLVFGSVTGLGGAVNDRKVEEGILIEVDAFLDDVLGQAEQQVGGLTDDFGDSGVRTIGLVHAQDDRKLGFEGLAQHETGLRQRALGSVDEQHDAIDHGDATLHLATEIGVARGIDDVEGDAFRMAVLGGQRAGVLHRGVLGEDGDALLAFQIVGIHHTVRDFLTLVEHVGLGQHRVDQGGLTVIDVCHNRYISDIAANRHRNLS